MKSVCWMLIIWLLCFCEVFVAVPANSTVPKISKIVVENWKELKFILLHENLGDSGPFWSAWFANSKNITATNYYKPCNHSRDDIWSVVDPFDKVFSDSMIILGVSRTNSSDGIVLSNLTRINIKDYVKPGIVNKVKFQLLRDAKNINALYFQTPTYSQNMTFNISIQCMNGYKEYFTVTYKRFDPHAFTKFKNIPRFTTCNISIRGISSDLRGFWSDEVVETVKTEMSVPLAAPKLCTYGGFTVLLINSTNLDVVLHFKGLTRDEARGPLQGYRAHLLSSFKMRRIEIALSKNGFQGLMRNDSNIMIEADHDISQDIYSHDPLINHRGIDDEEDLLFSNDQDMKFHVIDTNYRLHDDYQEHVSDYLYESHPDDKDDKEQVTYLEITNNQDYERFVKLYKSGNTSLENLLTIPKVSNGDSHTLLHHENKMMNTNSKTKDHNALSNKAKNLLELDRSFDVENIFVLMGLDSGVRHQVSVDVMTKRGYNETLELTFITLPNFEDFRVLPEIRDVDVVYSDKSLLIFWRMMCDDTLSDLVFTIYFCPERFFHIDGKGCLRLLDWFQAEIIFQSSTHRKSMNYFRQEIRFPPHSHPVNHEIQRSFIFGVSVALKSGLSKGIKWRTCEYDLEKDPILPKVNIYNITSESASITIDKAKCHFGSGYIFAFNVSYCTLQHNADSTCSGLGVNFFLHSDVTKFELKNLKERQAYLLSVNVSDINKMSSLAFKTIPYDVNEEQMSVIQRYQRASQIPFSGSHSAFFSPNVIHFMTADKHLPSTQVVVVHPFMMAFLAIIGVVILALLLLGFLVICRLYRKSIKRFNEWNTVRIEPPHQAVSQSYDGSTPVNVNITVHDDYNDDVVLKTRQNILPLLSGDHSKSSFPINSDSDFIKVEGISMRSVASDSFKSFSDAEDFHVFSNDGGGDFVSIFSPQKSLKPDRSSESERKQLSSPSFESLTNCKDENDFLRSRSVNGMQMDHSLRKSIKAPVGSKVFRNGRPTETPGKLTKAVHPLSHSPSPEQDKIDNQIEKIEIIKQEAVTFSRVLPPIAGKSQITPVTAIALCLPMLKHEEYSDSDLFKVQKAAKQDHLKRKGSEIISSSHSLDFSRMHTSHVTSLTSSSSSLLQNPRNISLTLNEIHDLDYDLPRSIASPLVKQHFDSNALFSSLTSLNNVLCKEASSMNLSPLNILTNSTSSFFSSFSSAPSFMHSDMVISHENSSMPVLPPMSEQSPSFTSSVPSSGLIYASSSSPLSSSSDLLTISSKFNPLCSSSKSLTLLQTSGEGSILLHLPAENVGRDDDYTGCQEHSVLPIRIDETIFNQPAHPVIARLDSEGSSSSDGSGVLE